MLLIPIAILVIVLFAVIIYRNRMDKKEFEEELNEEDEHVHAPTFLGDKKMKSVSGT